MFLRFLKDESGATAIEYGLIAALIVARLMFGKADLTMALNGALAGLVAITAEPADPSPLLATMISVALVAGATTVGSSLNSKFDSIGTTVGSGI